MTELAAGEPDARLTAACSRPVDLPDGPMSAGAVERAWSRDRIALDDCRRRHGAVVIFYRERDAGLSGAAEKTSR